MPLNRICFDIETEPFSNDFRHAESLPSRQQHAPTMRVACVYFESSNTYEFFAQDEASQLITLIQNADEVITFNGKGFDILVLRKHYGLKGKVPQRGKHVDLHEVLTAKAGFRVSLDKASRLNLKEPKHTSGREMSNLDLEALKEACRSDVSQTYRLWLAHANGELRAPEYAPRQFGLSELIGGPGHHMPSLCPICHDVGSIEFVESETEEMTDGQFAEYIAGTQGFAVCASCNSLVVWNV
jgi:hypothetical protein